MNSAMERLDDGLYTRQHDLWLDTSGKAVIIGVGGIGSWVALNVASAGIDELVLIDPDHLEPHNLNRTPYKKIHTDNEDMKVEAMLDLIYERRDAIDVHTFDSMVGEVPTHVLEDADYVLDCRDTADPLPDTVPDSAEVVAAGYDGLSTTLHLNPDYEGLWGDGGDGYEVTPSFVVPPQFLASLVTLIISAPEQLTEEERVVTLDIRSVLALLVELGGSIDEDGESVSLDLTSEEEEEGEDSGDEGEEE